MIDGVNPVNSRMRSLKFLSLRALFDFAAQRVSFPHDFSGNPYPPGLMDARLKRSGMTNSAKLFHLKKVHGNEKISIGILHLIVAFRKQECR